MDDTTPPATLENHHDAIFGNKGKYIKGLYPMVTEMSADIKSIKISLEEADEVKQALENTAKGRGQVVGFVGKVVTWAATLTAFLSGVYALLAYIRGT